MSKAILLDENDVVEALAEYFGVTVSDVIQSGRFYIVDMGEEKEGEK